MREKFLKTSVLAILALAVGGMLFASGEVQYQGSNAATVAAGGAGVRAPGSLTTLWDGSTGSGGNTFDIVPNRSIHITALDINVDAAGTTTTVDLYYKAGTCVGYELNAAAWTLLTSGTGVSAGRGLPTFIDLPGAVGTNFDAGLTYGIYVAVTSYPSGTICWYTQGGPTTFSNADLSLTTNTGQADPPFSNSFYPRQWNGNFYYDDGGPDLPRVDIKCNGDDAGVTMFHGTNAKLDYSFHSGIGAGAPVDLWLALKHPFSFFTYDGIGPYMGWNLGLGNAFYTGPLADQTGTCLDHALGINSYKAFIAIDTSANGVLNMGAIFAMDSVDFDVTAPPKIYAWDDGSTENLLAWTSGGDMCWLNGWTAYAGGETLLDMQCIFGSAMYPGYAPGNGTNCNGYIWDDPTNDSDPSDCTLLATEPLVVAQVDTDIYNVFPLTAPVVVSQVFFVGCVMPHGVGEYCMPMDQSGTYVSGASWYCGTNTMGGFDPNVLTNNQYVPAEYGVFNCIRAGY